LDSDGAGVSVGIALIERQASAADALRLADQAMPRQGRGQGRVSDRDAAGRTRV